MHHSTHISTRFPYTTLFRSNKSKDADRLLTHVVTKIVGNRRITHHNKNQLEYGRQGNETPGGVGQHVQNILLGCQLLARGGLYTLGGSNKGDKQKENHQHPKARHGQDRKSVV